MILYHYDKINYYKQDNGLYLLYDIFIKNNELYLICPIYFNSEREKLESIETYYKKII
jgi:hypothetical protein